MIYLLTMEEGDAIHNMAMVEKGVIVEKISIEDEAKLCPSMVRFDFIKRSLIAEVNRVLEATANVMALHVLDILSHVNWDSLRLTDGYVKPMERLNY